MNDASKTVYSDNQIPMLKSGKPIELAPWFKENYLRVNLHEWRDRPPGYWLIGRGIIVGLGLEEGKLGYAIMPAPDGINWNKQVVSEDGKPVDLPYAYADFDKIGLGEEIK
jgi:hypothetical protein